MPKLSKLSPEFLAVIQRSRTPAWRLGGVRRPYSLGSPTGVTGGAKVNHTPNSASHTITIPKQPTIAICMPNSLPRTVPIVNTQ